MKTDAPKYTDYGLQNRGEVVKDSAVTECLYEKGHRPAYIEQDGKYFYTCEICMIKFETEKEG